MKCRALHLCVLSAILGGTNAYAQATLPDAPSMRIADRSFWIATTFAAVAAVGDAESTMHVLRNPTCREYNPLLGAHPRRLQLYATGAVAHVFIAWWAHRLKKHGSRNWYLPPLIFAIGHGGAALWNVAGSGC